MQVSVGHRVDRDRRWHVLTDSRDLLFVDQDLDFHLLGIGQFDQNLTLANTGTRFQDPFASATTIEFFLVNNFAGYSGWYDDFAVSQLFFDFVECVFFNAFGFLSIANLDFGGCDVTVQQYQFFFLGDVN